MIFDFFKATVVTGMAGLCWIASELSDSHSRLQGVLNGLQKENYQLAQELFFQVTI